MALPLSTKVSSRLESESFGSSEREREMGRAPCCDKASVKRGPWSPEEDSKLKEYIEKHGTGGNWISLPQKAGLNRCGKSCRLRWLNYLRPNIKHGDFSDEEDRIICSLYVNIGSRWSIIAAQLPGRTDNDIKNYWNTKLKKKLMGLLPITTTTAHHRKPPPSPSSHPLSSSSIYTDYCSHSSFTCPEPISLPFNNNNYENTSCTTTSVSLLPFYQNQDQSMVSVSPMQYNYPMRDSMLMFGSEGSCSSSDGSCTQVSHGKEIKQEEMGYNQSYMSNGFEDYNNNFMLSYNNSINGGVVYTGQTLTPLDYGLEDIKQLISSHSSSSGFNIDENKTEEKAMYCYYY